MLDEAEILGHRVRDADIRGEVTIISGHTQTGKGGVVMNQQYQVRIEETFVIIVLWSDKV